MERSSSWKPTALGIWQSSDDFVDQELWKACNLQGNYAPSKEAAALQTDEAQEMMPEAEDEKYREAFHKGYRSGFQEAWGKGFSHGLDYCSVFLLRL